MSAGRERQRELTPLPRHQIASGDSPHPRRSVSGGGGGSPLSPLLRSRTEETCRGWKVGADCRTRGKGVYNWRRAYASRRPCSKRRTKAERRDDGKKTRQPGERRRRDLLSQDSPYTRASESYARIPKGFSLQYPFSRYFHFLPF